MIYKNVASPKSTLENPRAKDINNFYFMGVFCTKIDDFEKFLGFEKVKAIRLGDPKA